jgi:hypothetical protein
MVLSINPFYRWNALDFFSDCDEEKIHLSYMSILFFPLSTQNHITQYPLSTEALLNLSIIFFKSSLKLVLNCYM